MFVKSFAEELMLLEQINLPNKLQLFSLYKDLYKFLIISIDDNLKLEYSDFLTNTFIKILNNLNNNDNINTVMKEFLEKIKLNKYSNQEPLITYINMFDFNLDKILTIKTEASIIDKTNYPFKIKAILLEIYKNYIETIAYNLDKFYDANDTKNYVLEIKETLKSKLETILTKNINYFRENLYLETKDRIIDSYYKKEFDFFNFKNNISEYFVYSLDDLEKEIFIDVLIDIIIELDNKEFLENSNVLYFRELASKYNVSISQIIDKLEVVKLKIDEFKIEKPELSI